MGFAIAHLQFTHPTLAHGIANPIQQRASAMCLESITRFTQMTLGTREWFVRGAYITQFN
ncbi:MAG: hypothetical protein DRQ49_04410 [Gammaproteobacteria bacterium]|nr:MAG: hypothetical protein DRQ49_04410 [Gammaproteobacteria bacterium]RKZ44079.1 MAG: hypothetical protein DRQ41_03670 [Gammaproteobacteria bacterium]